MEEPAISDCTPQAGTAPAQQMSVDAPAPASTAGDVLPNPQPLPADVSTPAHQPPVSTPPTQPPMAVATPARSAFPTLSQVRAMRAASTEEALRREHPLPAEPGQPAKTTVAAPVETPVEAIAGQPVVIPVAARVAARVSARVEVSEHAAPVASASPAIVAVAEARAPATPAPDKPAALPEQHAVAAQVRPVRERARRLTPDAVPVLRGVGTDAGGRRDA